MKIVKPLCFWIFVPTKVGGRVKVKVFLKGECGLHKHAAQRNNPLIVQTFIRSRRDRANKHTFYKPRRIPDNTVVHLDSCLWPSGRCQEQFLYFSCACVCKLLRKISSSLAAKCCIVFTSQPLTYVHLCLVFHFCETKRPGRCHSVVLPLVLKQ